MQETELILKNAIVITVNKNFDIFEPGAIVISGKKILDVGYEKEILSKYKAKEVIDCDGKILMPGLVNAHTHLPMALLRGVMDDLRLDEWLNNYIFPIEGTFMNENTVRLGTELACAELIKSGVTCCNEMYYWENELAETLTKAGMRGLISRVITCFPGVDKIEVAKKFELGHEFVAKYKNDSLITPTIAPHAPYTNSEDTIKQSIDFAKKHDVMLNMHLAETKNEVKDLSDKYGSVAGYLEKLGFYDCKLNFAHCVHLTDKDIKAFAAHKIGVAHNPESNMKLASGAAPVTAMLEAGVNVGIGTDGNSSNNDLDMFSEMRSASFLAKIQADSPVALTAKQVVYMATMGGAKSIFLDDKIGSIESGKCADLILVNINTLHNLPRYRHNPDGLYSQIVYAAKSTDVTDVMCNGKWLMKETKLQTIDVKPLLAEAQKFTAQVDDFVRKVRSNS